MNLERAIEIAVKAHAGQVDKGGQPYILHPLRVMMAVATIEEKIVAVLHDVVEDSDIEFEDLSTEGFNDEIIEALKSVTKSADDADYFAFIERAKLNTLGAAVKIADLKDNLDISRLQELDEKDLERINKYKKSLAVLLAWIED